MKMEEIQEKLLGKTKEELKDVISNLNLEIINLKQQIIFLLEEKHNIEHDNDLEEKYFELLNKTP